MLALLLAATLTDSLWEAAKPVYEKTIAHPFLQELSSGSLSKARFETYLTQDITYLRAYAEILKTLAAKAPKPAWQAFLNKSSKDCDQEITHIHNAYLKGRQNSSPPSAANAAYIKFLRETVNKGTFAEGLAAVLPCYWIYWEVGKSLKAKGSKNREYQRWIDYYSDPAYGKVVAEILAMMNEAAANADHAKLKQLFLTGAQHEFQFWHSAYHLQR